MGYLKTDLSRLSYREAWRIGGLVLLNLVICRLLRRSFYSSVLVPDAPAIVRLSPDEVREGLRQALLPTLRLVTACDFHPVLHYTVDTRETSDGLAVAALHTSGLALCTVVYAEAGAERDLGITVFSRLQGGGFIATGDGGRIFDPPPAIDAASMPGCPPEAVIAAHMRRIQRKTVVPIADGDAGPVLLEVQRVILEHNVRRGVFVPAT